jgi:hypothetical protein
MNAIKGKYHDGNVVLDRKTDWPNDAEVLVELINSSKGLGMREEEWSDTPEAIAQWLQWYETIEPFLSPEDEAAWHAALKAQEDYEKAIFNSRADELKRMFD